MVSSSSSSSSSDDEEERLVVPSCVSTVIACLAAVDDCKRRFDFVGIAGGECPASVVLDKGNTALLPVVLILSLVLC